jgi:hypothetical protein
MRLRVLGLCDVREMQQFAVVSFEPSSTSSNELAYPTRLFPKFSLEFGQKRVNFYTSQ